MAARGQAIARGDKKDKRDGEDRRPKPRRSIQDGLVAPIPPAGAPANWQGPPRVLGTPRSGIFAESAPEVIRPAQSLPRTPLPGPRVSVPPPSRPVTPPPPASARAGPIMPGPAMRTGMPSTGQPQIGQPQIGQPVPAPQMRPPLRPIAAPTSAPIPPLPPSSGLAQMPPNMDAALGRSSVGPITMGGAPPPRMVDSAPGGTMEVSVPPPAGPASPMVPISGRAAPGPMFPEDPRTGPGPAGPMNISAPSGPVGPSSPTLSTNANMGGLTLPGQAPTLQQTTPPVVLRALPASLSPTTFPDGFHSVPGNVPQLGQPGEIQMGPQRVAAPPTGAPGMVPPIDPAAIQTFLQRMGMR